MTHHSSHPSISTDLNLISVHELFEHTHDVFHLIALRSFEIFEARGRVNGNDREDWFLAEHELLTPVKFHISESGDLLIARAEVPGFNSQEIKASVEPRWLSISGKSEPRKDHQSGKHIHSLGHERMIFRVIDLNRSHAILGLYAVPCGNSAPYLTRLINSSGQRNFV